MQMLKVVSAKQLKKDEIGYCELEGAIYHNDGEKTYKLDSPERKLSPYQKKQALDSEIELMILRYAEKVGTPEAQELNKKIRDFFLKKIDESFEDGERSN